MTSRPELRQQYDIIGSIQPALHVPQNWNYENPAPLFRAFMHPPHDVGGQHDVPVYYEEKEEEQWELNTYVTCEVLGWRGVWTAEERRRRADNDWVTRSISACPITDAGFGPRPGCSSTKNTSR